MSTQEVATASFGILAWMATTLLAASDVAFVSEPGANAILSLGSGAIGGLAWQLRPEKMKLPRQVAGEILCSACAGAIASLYIDFQGWEWGQSTLGKFAGSFVFGAGGSVLIGAIFTHFRKQIEKKDG